MALKVKILKDDRKILAQGMLDGAVPFHFEDSGDRWRVRIGKNWHHTGFERHVIGQPNLADARQKIYRAIARFRNECKPTMA
ncbi:hypothetical protein EYC08_18125 [Tabrizicola sp. WMC-M-20]|nr:hypothetical protein EYC08_18125 [Tabrizicola sp. WMC-M-20]